MAKVKLKKGSTEETADEATDEVIEEVIETASAVESAPAPVAEAVPVKASKVEAVAVQTIPEATIQKVPRDFVKIVALQDIEPPPTVGHYSVGKELLITKFKAMSNYHVPRFVAEHLEEKKAASILE